MITSEKLTEKWTAGTPAEVDHDVFSLPENHEELDVISRLEANIRRLHAVNARVNYLLSEVKDLIAK